MIYDSFFFLMIIILNHYVDGCSRYYGDDGCNDDCYFCNGSNGYELWCLFKGY